MVGLQRPWGRMAYTDSGGTGYPFVFLHGTGCDAPDWQTTCDRLSSDAVRKVVLEFRGHGCSDVPQGPFVIEDLAEDAAALMAHLGLTRPVLVGHSLGGMVAMAVARRGEAVSGLVLLEGWTSLACASRAFEGNRMYGRLSEDDVLRIRSKSGTTRGRFAPERWAHFWDSVKMFDGSAFLRETALPIWEVYGAMGKTDATEGLLGVPDRLNLTRVWIDGAGHYLPHERPEEVAAICLTALERVI